MKTRDFRSQRDVLPQTRVVRHKTPPFAHFGHLADLFVAQVAEDVEEDFVGQFFDGLQEMRRRGDVYKRTSSREMRVEKQGKFPTVAAKGLTAVPSLKYTWDASKAN